MRCTQLSQMCQSYMCMAEDDRIGENCQENETNKVENLCNSFPCKNGGSCILDDSEYICLCREGFGGENCEKSQGHFVDVCQNNPCENGAQCLNSFTSNNVMISSGEFTCKCLPGFEGFNCNETTGTLPGSDLCNGNNLSVCDNQGTCSNTYTSTGSLNFVCTCPNGFFGQKCDLPTIDPCSSNPCHNGAICTPHSTYFICDCPEGVGGPTCEGLTGISTAPNIENCPGPIIMSSAVPTVVPWQWPKVTDINGDLVPLVEANSAPEAVHEPDTTLTVNLVYESLAGIRATCSFVIVVSGNGQ
ncbi:Protein delta-like 2 [Holothuria leucospilota]|uniref:Protein delta-like 2 n=1 Tax=Holothuria leucospilota TaxID=206669 RepID=A0A9Q1H2Z1_HOLLE|nr:Protein delta-like 2 [Holothuria leucospilota]